MDVYEWIYQILVEGIKYVVVAHWFFGYEFSRKKTRFLFILYPLMIPVVEMTTEYTRISNAIFWYKYFF